MLVFGLELSAFLIVDMANFVANDDIWWVRISFWKANAIKKSNESHAVKNSESYDSFVLVFSNIYIYILYNYNRL